MGIKVRVPEFEIELDDAWGLTPQEVCKSFSTHYHSFNHFLDEQTDIVGTLIIIDEATSLPSVKFVFGGKEGYSIQGLSPEERGV